MNPLRSWPLIALLVSGLPAQQEADYELFGTGCPGHFGVPVLEPIPQSFPVLGETFTLELRNLPVGPSGALALVLFGFSNTQWGPDPLPLDLTHFGLPGCTAYIRIDAAFLVSSQVSTAQFPLDIANDPTLLGVRFYNQALVQSSGTNLFGGVVTNAGEGTVGDMPRTLVVTETFDDSSQRDELSSSGTWGGSRAEPGPLGGDGRHGSFDPTTGTQILPDTYLWDTDNTVIPAELTLSGQPEVVTDGRFYFTDFDLPPGVQVEFTGSKPVQIFVWGKARIGGTLSADAPDALPFAARPIGSEDPIAGQPGGAGGPGGGTGGRGADSGDGLGNQPAFNGAHGEDVRLPAGHAYVSRAIGTGGPGSPQYPPSGLDDDITFGALFDLRSGMIGAGGGGGGLLEPGEVGMAVVTGTDPVEYPDDLGPPTPGGLAISLFANAQGMLPPGTSSLEHFAIGGSGGGGGGSHPFLAPASEPAQYWKAGAAGTGGGGAIAIRSGNAIAIEPIGEVLVRGGDGIRFDSSGDGYPMPGGGGSGGTVLLQTALIGGIQQAGVIDASGGGASVSSSSGPASGNTRGGHGSRGFIRMETPDGDIEFGNTSPPELAGSAGVLLDRDTATGVRSLWYTTGESAPSFLRYEVEAEIDSVPTLFSDDDAVSTLTADDPNGPVHVMFQAARLDPNTGLPIPGSIGPWRRYAGSASGQLETLNLDDGDAFRFQVVFNRDVTQSLALTRVSVFYF